MSVPTRSELGDFLRSRRRKLGEQVAGTTNGRARRTPGLRREEVAELAGIGVDWYVRLEQGRMVSPSATTIDALARALRLDEVEHNHLRALARNVERPRFQRESVPQAIQRLLDGLSQPAYVTGRRWDVLAWNAEAAAVLTDFASTPEGDRNILVYMLLDPGARRRFGAGWSVEARRMVALFRATHDMWAGDPAFTALEDRLREGSPEFSAWWESHDIRSGAGGEKVLHHPERGLLRFEYATFQANDDPALKLAIYTPITAAAAAPSSS